MKTNEEMTASVLSRIQTEKSELRRKRKQIIIPCCLALCVAAAAAAAGILHKGPVQTAASMDSFHGNQAQNEQLYGMADAAENRAPNGNENEPLPGSTAASFPAGEEQKSTAPVKQETTKKQEAITVVPDGGAVKSGDGYSSWPNEASAEGSYNKGGISSAVMGICVKLKGEILSRDAGAAYIRENAPSLASALRADPIIGPGELRFSTVGYSHLTVSEDEGLFVNTAFVDYPVFRDGKVIAVVTAYMDNGKIYSCPAYGGPGLAALNKALDADPNGDVVFLYWGQVPEVFITQNNTFFFNPCAIPVEKGVDYYNFFYGHGNEANKAEMLASAVTV